MQRVMERPRQTAKRPSRRKMMKDHFEFSDFLLLSAEYNRRMTEIGRLMRKAGSSKMELRHRLDDLMKQQLECSNRIREAIRSMMGWRY